MLPHLVPLSAVPWAPWWSLLVFSSLNAPVVFLPEEPDFAADLPRGLLCSGRPWVPAAFEFQLTYHFPSEPNADRHPPPEAPCTLSVPLSDSAQFFSS